MLSNTWSLGRVLPPRLSEGLPAPGPLSLVPPLHPHPPPMPGPILTPRSVPLCFELSTLCLLFDGKHLLARVIFFSFLFLQLEGVGVVETGKEQ